MLTPFLLDAVPLPCCQCSQIRVAYSLSQLQETWPVPLFTRIHRIEWGLTLKVFIEQQISVSINT